MSFAQGLESGTRMAKSWLDTYNTVEEQTRKRRASEEIAALGRDEPYGGLPPQGLVTPASTPLPAATTPEVTPMGAGTPAAMTPPPPAAMVPPAPAAMEAPAAVPPQGLTRGTPMSQRLKQQADIFTKYGLSDQAEQYRLKAYDVSRQEEADARTREGDVRTRTEFQNKQNTNQAAQFIAKQQQTGRPLDMVLIAEAQSKFPGSDYNTLLTTATNVLGVDQKFAEEKVRKLVTDINGAVAQGETSFNNLLKSFADPDKTDNIIPEYKKVRGGYQVMYGDKPMSPLFTDAAGISALQQAGSFYTNNAINKPFETAIQIASLQGKAAATKASEAATVASGAAANLSNLRAKGLTRDAATTKKLDEIEQKFEALTPEEKVGAKGRALTMDYNMAAAGPGKQLALGTAARPEFTPKDYAATIKNFTDAGFSQTDALIRADQLYGRAPADVNVDAGLQKANAEKAAKTPTATTRKGPSDLSTVAIEKIRTDAAALDATIAQTQAQASAAVRSNDVNSIKLYGDRLNALRAQRAALTEGLTAAAVQTLGLK